MGKRSSFERREADFYPTPWAAVVPLIPYLRGINSFAEPCAGDGDLVRHVELLGLRCVYQGDIRNGQDALELDRYGGAQVIITNPPWSRNVMHRLITHFQSIAPTWLLLDSDWAQTKQATPFLPSCSHIVAIGRVKWIEGSKHTGNDNACWYRFDAKHAAGPVFHGRDQGADQGSNHVLERRICEQCGKAYDQWRRSSSRFCSPACKQQAYRRRLVMASNVGALSVTPTVTLAPSNIAAEEFRYVRHTDVARYKAEGWELLPALDGTHHGEYSTLMRRRLGTDFKR
ncbi:hypothetical protein [Bradyrhizobium liaoningense]|uniref:hypothetical protein n=1 Tax=Bradyrhizobium liaoningense TaxID=43992 RepID=UPI001FE57B48|nr:hypothetical protein [Bradyrhizobium liaoningense]